MFTGREAKEEFPLLKRLELIVEGVQARGGRRSARVDAGLGFESSRAQVRTPAKSSKKAVDSHSGPKLRPARLARGNMLNCSAPARASGGSTRADGR